jgi:hypothetical protein
LTSRSAARVILTPPNLRKRHDRRKAGADVVAACFVIDLPDLGGAKKLAELSVPVRSLIAFEGH